MGTLFCGMGGSRVRGENAFPKRAQINARSPSPASVLLPQDQPFSPVSQWNLYVELQSEVFYIHLLNCSLHQASSLLRSKTKKLISVIMTIKGHEAGICPVSQNPTCLHALGR